MATILIVEDERLIAGNIKRALLRLGHRPLEPVSNSVAVLRALELHPVDLILMDINIEGDLDGIETAVLVHQRYPMPIIFLTARTDAEARAHAQVAKPAGFIVKPFTEEGLRSHIEAALR